MSDLEQVARFLGEPYFFGRHPNIASYTGIWITRPLEHDEENSDQLTDADLLLALLERAMNLKVDVHVGCRADSAQCQAGLSKYSASGPTPLAAMIQAVVKYQEGK